ncbi:MAG: hypothetical protein ABF811_09900 [Pseudoclavibacter sp.]
MDFKIRLNTMPVIHLTAAAAPSDLVLAFAAALQQAGFTSLDSPESRPSADDGVPWETMALKIGSSSGAFLRDLADEMVPGLALFGKRGGGSRTPRRVVVAARRTQSAPGISPETARSEVYVAQIDSSSDRSIFDRAVEAVVTDLRQRGLLRSGPEEHRPSGTMPPADCPANRQRFRALHRD